MCIYILYRYVYFVVCEVPSKGEITCIAEKLLAAQGLWSMEWVSEYTSLSFSQISLHCGSEESV